MDDIVEAIDSAAATTQPRPTVVVVRDASCARWLARELAGRGPRLGTTVLALKAFIRECDGLLGGERYSQSEILARVGTSLDSVGKFSLVAQMPAYQAIVLSLYEELERAFRVGGAPLPEVQGRDADLLAAFRVFTESLAGDSQRDWSGTAPARILLRRDELPRIHRAALYSVGFERGDAWERTWLLALGATAIDGRPLREHSKEPSRPMARVATYVQQCAGPEVEIAAIARRLRAQPQPVRIFVPAGEVDRWARRLVHRDIPVRAWLPLTPGSSAAAVCVHALLRCVGTGARVTSEDLSTVLFGPALRMWPEHYGLARQRWDKMRRRSGTLAEWKRRLEDSATSSLALDAARHGERAEVRDRILLGCRVLENQIDRLASIHTSSQLLALLREAGFVSSSRATGPDSAIASREVVDFLRTQENLPLDGVAVQVEHLLGRLSAGEWLDERSAAVVCVLPYQAALDRWEGLTILAGLDRFPQPPVAGPLLRDATREQLGLTTAAAKYLTERDTLDVLASGGELWLSWRSRDGVGARSAPGPWIAARTEDPPPVAVGLDQLAQPAAPGQATCELEADVTRPERCALLMRRVTAISCHHSHEITRHTGRLGVSVPASRPYSVSALTTFARNPYRYFIDRVLGLREVVEEDDSLSAMEQGNLVHTVLEAVLRDRLEAGPLDLASDRDVLLRHSQKLLVQHFAATSEGLLSRPVWSGELRRWSQEMARWWANVPDEGARVVAVELNFGGTTKPLSLPLGDGVELPFVGSIDRVDLCRDGSLRVVDYKTGRAVMPRLLTRDILCGRHLQLPLYAVVLQKLMELGALAPYATATATAPKIASLQLDFLKASATGKRQSTELAYQLNDSEGQASVSLGEVAVSFAAAYVQAIEQGSFPLVRRFEERGIGQDSLRSVLRIEPDEAHRSSGLPHTYAPSTVGVDSMPFAEGLT